MRGGGDSWLHDVCADQSVGPGEGQGPGPAALHTRHSQIPVCERGSEYIHEGVDGAHDGLQHLQPRRYPRLRDRQEDERAARVPAVRPVVDKRR